MTCAGAGLNEEGHAFAQIDGISQKLVVRDCLGMLRVPIILQPMAKVVE